MGHRVGQNVRVGVIGAGSWAASNHIPVLKNRSDVDLVVACRKGKDRLDELQSRFGFKHTTEDYEKALSYHLDAIVIASPAGLHYEHTLAALEAGANVLCEKPLRFLRKRHGIWMLRQDGSADIS
ncbi:MAG: Gfo/Idh/MocA family oxidoreductase [Acidobacteria bacterium]|nr:Gfo/Idh/MocA family oxidoreductase [Acidobacteriota bacterium]